MPQRRQYRHRHYSDRAPLARAAAAAVKALALGTARPLLADQTTEELAAVFSTHWASLSARERYRLRTALDEAGVKGHTEVDSLVIWFRASVGSTRARLTAAQPALHNAGRCWRPYEQPYGLMRQ